MEKDAANEVAAALLARISRYKTKNGDSEQLQADRLEVMAFKHRIRFESDTLTKAETIAFSKKWLEKYPS